MLVCYMVASLGLMPLSGVNKGYEDKKYKDDKLCAISAARASSSGSGVMVARKRTLKLTTHPRCDTCRGLTLNSKLKYLNNSIKTYKHLPKGRMTSERIVKVQRSLEVRKAGSQTGTTNTAISAYQSELLFIIRFLKS
jgi:hypothetical protein